MEMGARQALLRAVTEAAVLGRAGRELAPDWPKRRQSTSDGDDPFATNDPSVSEADPDRLARRVCENLDEAPGIRSTLVLPIAEQPPGTQLPAEA